MAGRRLRQRAVAEGGDHDSLDGGERLAAWPKTMDAGFEDLLGEFQLGQAAAVVDLAAMAIHHADVGISVESAPTLPRTQSMWVLLEKDLGVLAADVMEGRRIFATR
jgi:hypothetical protein